MPKFLVLANGNMFIGLDRHAQVRDLYFPHVGLENHTGGYYTHKLGLWTPERFAWMDDPDWQTDINYISDTLSGLTTATNPNLGLKVDITDVIYNEKDIFVRQVDITNLRDQPRLVKMFFHRIFRLVW